jgi:hypothetical protein
MKPGLFRTFAVLMIGVVITACGGNPIASELPTSAPALPTQPSASPVISVKLPRGVFVNTHDDYGLTYCNLQGQAVTQFKMPGITNLGPGEVVIAGSVTSGPIQVPIIYLEHNPEPGLKVNVNDQISSLVQSPNIFQIAGAPGLPVLAFSRVDPQEKGQTYKVFVGTLETIASAPAIISHFDEKILYVYNPLAVEADGSSIEGVWYTRTPWGVGGVGFLRNHGLFFYDYVSGFIKEYLNDDQNFQGLSPDHSMAAIMDESIKDKPVLKVRNIKTNEVTDLGVDPGSDHGAGAIQFSPGNRYLAWMEASGTTMSDTPDYHSRLRVARLGATNQMMLDLTDEAASRMLGFSEVHSVSPAGWLDDMTLLVNTQAGLKKLDVASGKFTDFCPGNFVAFGY